MLCPSGVMWGRGCPWLGSIVHRYSSWVQSAKRLTPRLWLLPSLEFHSCIVEQGVEGWSGICQQAAVAGAASGHTLSFFRHLPINDGAWMRTSRLQASSLSCCPPQGAAVCL